MNVHGTCVSFSYHNMSVAKVVKYRINVGIDISIRYRYHTGSTKVRVNSIDRDEISFFGGQAKIALAKAAILRAPRQFSRAPRQK